MSPAPKTEPNSPPLRYLCVVDVEATCEEGDFRAVDHEIIELPVVLLDLQPAGGGVPSVVDHFHSFVRPTERPRLSDFCTGLTGVTQAQVDAAPTLPQVLDAVHAWLASRGLLLSFPSITHEEEVKAATPAASAVATATTASMGSSFVRAMDNNPFAALLDQESGAEAASEEDDEPFAVVEVEVELRTGVSFASDGPWDFDQFLHRECARKGLRKPAYYDDWVDVRRAFAEHHKLPKPVNIEKMLEMLGTKFEGRPHCGLDDARNVARIAARCAADGATFRRNCKVRPPKKAVEGAMGRRKKR